MKQALKNEMDMLGLINKIQEHLVVLDKKIDTLMNRSLTEVKPSPKPAVDNARPKERIMYTAICADCKKECKIPFKPSGDRPVYCQDCFSRRKVISLSKVSFADKHKELLPVPTVSDKIADVQKPRAKSKKKAVTVKKPIGKKKLVPKKK